MNYFATKYHYLDEKNIPKMLGTWIMLRKYKGVQAIWDGGITRKRSLREIPFVSKTNKHDISTGLWSIGRNGKPKVIPAPNSWLNCLPKNIPICGELWYNDSESKVMSIITQHNSSTYNRFLWERIKFISFNIRPYNLWTVDKYSPPDKYNNINFNKAFNILTDICSYSSILILPKNKLLDSTNNWKKFKQYAIENKWEGVVLQNLSTKYKIGISKDTVKWKKIYDHEVKILNYTKGKGKYINNIGALIVSLIWGENAQTILGGESANLSGKIIFELSGGLIDEDRIFPHKRCSIGTTLKIKFNGITRYGVPQHARIDWSK